MMSNSYSPDALESQLLSLLAKFDSVERGTAYTNTSCYVRRWGITSMLAEVRTLELWRAVIGECLAAVFYVLLVCGAYSPWAGQATPPERHLVISLVAGFAMTVLVHCFMQVSGGQVNPAVTLSLACMRRISPLRALMFVLAQLGGGIAGAALLFGATSSNYTGDLGATSVSRIISTGQGFGVEFLLSFVVVLAYFSAMCPHKRSLGDHPAVIIGLAYLSTTLVGLPLTGASMNPARSLGPAFVMNKWSHHWVYWAGPVLGGITAAFIHDFIFNPRRSPLSRNSSTEAGADGGECGGDAMSATDDGAGDHHLGGVRRAPKVPPTVSGAPSGGALSSTQYNPLRRHSRHSSSQPPPPPSDVYTPESVFVYDDCIYSGSKSLYTPSSRQTNLHRSQSVYTRPLPVPNDKTTSPTNTEVTPSGGTATNGLLHNNLSIYNQHLPNNIDKITPTPLTSLYSKNIGTVTQSHLESEFTSSKALSTNKSNLIKPEPIYKTAPSSVSSVTQHNNQNHIHAAYQQQQQHHHNSNLHNQSFSAHHQPLHHSHQQQQRCGSVMSSINTKYHPGEDDDSSQYNYSRSYGRNRPDLQTPGSVQSDLTIPNSISSYPHYGTHGDKLY